MKRPLDHCSWCGTGLLLTLETVGTTPMYTMQSTRTKVNAPNWCMYSPFVSHSPALIDMGEPHTGIQLNIPKVHGWARCAYQ